MLRRVDQQALDNLRRYNSDQILERLQVEKLRRVTLDFDGSVLSTKRRAEGCAVGFNKQKKGARSYYPLFCTVAQSGQIFDHLHRSGNVHDSNGAAEFVIRCVEEVRAALGERTIIEVRMDSAFFSDEMVTVLKMLEVEFTISVPFERFVDLKNMITERGRWWQLFGAEKKTSYFEKKWKPQCWEKKERFVFICTETKKQSKEPVQLDLFEPVESGMDFKVIVTNKKGGTASVVKYHEGRGYQEKIFGEVKSQLPMGYIPCRRRMANEMYMQCAVLTHNLGRELQMSVEPRRLSPGVKRTAMWMFEGLGRLRGKIIQRAARLTWPQGKKTLTFADNPALKADLQRFMEA